MIKSNKNQAKGSFIVHNDRGIHTRPATEIVKCAGAFKSVIKLRYKSHLVNAKSLLGILMMAITKGTKVKIEAEGEDATEAVAALIALAENNFNIKY